MSYVIPDGLISHGGTDLKVDVLANSRAGEMNCEVLTVTVFHFPNHVHFLLWLSKDTKL